MNYKVITMAGLDPATSLQITMAALEAATQQARVSALKGHIFARYRSHRVAGSSPAMVKGVVL
jgi:hypothetical protein